MSHRPPTDGYLTCYRCGADVVEGASFCAVCGAPQQVVAARPRPAYQEPAGRPWWLPFAIIGGGIAALLAGVLVAALLAGGREEVGDASPTPSQSTSAGASASTAPGGSADPTPTAEPTPDTAVIIPNLGIAAVAIDVVNLRSQPNDGASLVEALDADRRLFIIGEPTEAGGLRWYRVATLANETCLDQCDLIGYVATPIAADEEAWISQATVDCPTSPMTHDALNALAPLEALHCYGNSEIVVTGTIDDVVGGYEAPIDYSPQWLAFPFAPPYFVAADDSPHPPLGFHPHPAADLEPPEPGDEVRVTGHFEDPAATSCEAFFVPEYEGDATDLLPNPVLLVLNCRATFAWTDYEVTGP